MSLTEGGCVMTEGGCVMTEGGCVTDGVWMCH